jgi:hypothetical protein
VVEPPSTFPFPAHIQNLKLYMTINVRDTSVYDRNRKMSLLRMPQEMSKLFRYVIYKSFVVLKNLQE